MISSPQLDFWFSFYVNRLERHGRNSLDFATIALQWKWKSIELPLKEKVE